MYYIIDRFEEKFVVCQNSETGEMINIKKRKVPKDVKQGDVLIFIDNKYLLDINETEKRKHIIHKKIKGLWN